MSVKPLEQIDTLFKKMNKTVLSMGMGEDDYFTL